ncbi:MAG: M16 family metallopeptidase [Thermodesulfobacteriota bacterium]
MSKKIIIILGLQLFAVLFFAQVTLGEHVSSMLPNHLPVLIFTNPGTSSVAIDLWVKAGSRYDPPGKSGLAHFVEHLLFKGTTKRTSIAISKEIASLGGRINAYTLWDYVQLRISVLSQHLPKALEILADIVQNSLITEEMVEKERKVILEEISLGNIYPPSYILNLITQTLFGDSQLGQPIAGTKETVTEISRSELFQFYKSHYLPNNSLLTLVGNIDPTPALPAINDKLNSWAAELSPPTPPAPSSHTEFREVYKRRFLDQAIVVVALRAASLTDRDRPAFEIINALLGTGAHSRLYQEIREENALAYLVGSIYYPLADTGIWATYAGTEPKNIKKVKSIFEYHLKKIQEESLSPEELTAVKNFLCGRTVMRLENNSALAEFLGPNFIFGPSLLPQEYLTQLQKVTPEDILRVAKKYFQNEKLSFFILKPYPGMRFFRGLF